MGESGRGGGGAGSECEGRASLCTAGTSQTLSQAALKLVLHVSLHRE